MSGFKGTKGPWSITGIGECNGIELEAIRIQSTDENEIDVCAVWDDLSLQESQANALLISKSHEMLDMLEKAKSILGNVGEFEIAKEIEQLIKSATEL